MMNMQKLMMEAQKMQKKLQNEQKELENSTYEGSSSLVNIVINGKKEVKSVKLNIDDEISNDDIEMLEDMILVAVNDANKKIDDATDKKMSKFGNIPGLF